MKRKLHGFPKRGSKIQINMRYRYFNDKNSTPSPKLFPEFHTYMLCWRSTLVTAISLVLFLLNFPNNKITEIKM